jgi:hypothetical protein
VVDTDELIVEKTDKVVKIGDREVMSVTTHDLREITADKIALIEASQAQSPGLNFMLQSQNIAGRWVYVEHAMQRDRWKPQERPAAAPPSYRFAEAHHYRKPVTSAWASASYRLSGVTGKIADLDADDRQRWNFTHQALGWKAKTLAGQPANRELAQIQSLDALEIMLGYLEKVESL